MDKKEEKAWYDQWSEGYGLINPYKKTAKKRKGAEGQMEKKAHKKQKVVIKKEKEVGRKKKVVGGVEKTPKVVGARQSRRKSSRVAISPLQKNQVTVPGQQLPLVGEVIGSENRRNIQWGPSKVTALTNNLVHVDGLPRVPSQQAKGKHSLFPGMVVEVRLPPLDDEVPRSTLTDTLTQ